MYICIYILYVLCIYPDFTLEVLFVLKTSKFLSCLGHLENRLD